MKKVIVSTIACAALIAPLAFAKDPNAQSANKKGTRAAHFGFVTPQQSGVTVTAATTPTKSVECVAASYQPSKTLFIHGDGPNSYTLEGRGHIFNSKGEVVRTGIKPGTPMHVYFTRDDAGRQTLDRVVLD
jgi:hypothetical protein